jgi:hypothetical protein
MTCPYPAIVNDPVLVTPDTVIELLTTTAPVIVPPALLKNVDVSTAGVASTH